MLSIQFCVWRRLCLFSVLLTLVIIPPSIALDITKQVSEGVTLMQRTSDDLTLPLLVNVVTVDLNNMLLSLKPALGKDVIYVDDINKGRETVSSITSRKGALIGINADFFPTDWGGDPLGLCIIDGELISEPNGSRPVFGITKDKTPVFDTPTLDASLTTKAGITQKIDGINRPRASGQIIAYTEAFGLAVQSKFSDTFIVASSPDLPVTPGKAINLTVTGVTQNATTCPIPKRGMIITGGGAGARFLDENIIVGDVIILKFDLNSAGTTDWGQVHQAIGGGPWLVRDCVEFVDGEAEGFKRDITNGSAPRSAVGMTGDNKLLLVTVDGRQNISGGLALHEMASLMKSLGAANAINLDGGGSTALSIAGMIVNSPSGGTERPIADALLVFTDKPAPAELPKVAITGSADQIPSGLSATLALISTDEFKPIAGCEQAKAIWGSVGGIGFVDQQGRYIPTRARKGSLAVYYDSVLVKRDIEVLCGPVTNVKIALTKDKLDPARAEVTISASDAFSNSTPGREVLLTVIGGTADFPAGITDEKGVYATGISWMSDTQEKSVKTSVEKVSSTISVK